MACPYDSYVVAQGLDMNEADHWEGALWFAALMLNEDPTQDVWITHWVDSEPLEEEDVMVSAG